MTSIVGKVVGHFHMENRPAQALAAKNYRRNPNDPTFPFGKKVNLIVIRSVFGWKHNYRTNQKEWGLISGGAGYNGIILGPKFAPNG
jgi:hypothetical protein